MIDRRRFLLSGISLLVPGTIMERLVELGLAQLRGGQRRVSDRGKALILRHRDAKRR